MNKQLVRWKIFVCQLAAISAAIGWGIDSKPPSDFDGMLTGWNGLILTLSVFCVCGCMLWSFYVIGPALLHALELVKHIIGAALLIASLAATVYLMIGINMAGLRPSPERAKATLDRYEFGGRGAQHKQYGVLRLVNGFEFRVPEPFLTKAKIYIGSEAHILLYRGNLFDWGMLDIAPKNK